jgi:signal transduction histidine kinase
MSTGGDNFGEPRKPAVGTDKGAEAGARGAARLGELSAAISHDFNKLLTVMLGYSELMLADLSSEDAARPFVEEINHAVYRGARLTRHLLDFSHTRAPKPELVDLNSAVQDLDGFLRVLMGAGVDLVRDLTPVVRLVRADRKHVDQALATLVLAARDASPMGGCVMIETFNVLLPSATRLGQAEIPAGAYVCLGVRENAIGANPSPRGASASLGGSGLPLVQQLAHQNGGYFAVESEPQRGRAFRVYLPPAEDA